MTTLIQGRKQEGTVVMKISETDPIGSILRLQVEFFGEAAISLDSLWRAGGCPVGKEPVRWATQAYSLIRAYSEYISNFPPPGSARCTDEPILWRWADTDSDPWRSGDLMGPGVLARLYAEYLRAANR